MHADDEIEVSFCVVNTSQRELLLEGLDAIASERESLPFASEVLVLDNGSRDGSAQAAGEHPVVDELIALHERRGKALERLGAHASRPGRYCLLLNEDSELLAGATVQTAPRARAGAVGRPVRGRSAPPGWQPQASAWRFPRPLSALAGVLMAASPIHGAEQGHQVREVNWCQSAALLVRREAAAEIGYMDPDFFVYSDEVDFAKRLRDAGWRSLYVPGAVAVHHEQLSTDMVPERRIIEMCRGRDLYMRKHHGLVAAWVVRILTAWTYALRAVAAVFVRGHSAKRYWFHVTATLHPERGEGLREAADAYNQQRADMESECE